MSQRINYFLIAIRSWKRILLIGVVVAIVATGLSFVRTLEYRSSVRLLILQRVNLGVDPYLAARSQETISENLANIIKTTSFFEKVLVAETNIDQSVFSNKEEKKRKQWGRMVETVVSRGSGLLTVQVFHKTRSQAELIATAVSGVLKNEGWTYLGGSDLTVQIVDAPLTTNWPVRPNVPINALGGFVLGLLGGALYVIFLAYRHPPHLIQGFLHGE